jgi:hypothetical protein
LGSGCRGNILGNLAADELAELGFFVKVVLGLVTGRQTKGIGLSLLLLPDRSGIRLLMVRLRS